MGQAKRRGNKEQRIDQARRRTKALDVCGGEDAMRKFFRANRENKEIARKADNKEDITPEESIKFARNRDYIKAFQEKFTEVYESAST